MRTLFPRWTPLSFLAALLGILLCAAFMYWTMRQFGRMTADFDRETSEPTSAGPTSSAPGTPAP